MRPAVFLDRDGTMIHESGYLSRLDALRWYPATIDMIRLLNRAGFLVFVTTNQGGIGLGLFDAAFVEHTHAVMDAAIREGGGRVDGWFYCPHHPRAITDAMRIACDCRKPRAGMITSACAARDVDLPRSFVIGDRLGDTQMARAVGATGILVRTGYGEEVVAGRMGPVPADTIVAADLAEAVLQVLDRSGVAA